MNKCILCNSKEDIVKHHTSYIPPITILLCRRCHRSVHAFIDIRRPRIKKIEETKDGGFHVVKLFKIGASGTLIATIPHQIRKKLDIKKGTHLKVTKKDNKLILEKIE